MNHYQAETMPLDVENWKYVNNTENQQFHYWNNITDMYQNVSVSEIFRANNKFSGERDIPPTTLYTLIQLQTAYILFLVSYLLYGLLLSLIKYCINNDFNSASFGTKFQHIVESVNIPEAYGDWDTDNNLCLNGHLKKWRKVLVEMLVMVLLQFITNICLLIPLVITGMIFIFYKHCVWSQNFKKTLDQFC